jgi:prevent-host-death family protein
VSASQLQASWAKYLHQVQQGLVVIITQREKPVAAMISAALYHELEH